MTFARLTALRDHHHKAACDQFEIASRMTGQPAEDMRAKAAQHVQWSEELSELLMAFATLRTCIT